MKRKYAKVVSAEVKPCRSYTVTLWTLTLDCGHTAQAIKWKSGWRTFEKPAPVRVVCRKCQVAATT